MKNELTVMTIRNKIYTIRDTQVMLDEDEYENLRSQIVTSRKQHGGRRYLPYAFTEQGVSMLSAVLRSQTAIEVSIKIIDNFVNMRRFLQNNASVFQKIESIEKRQISYEIKNDTKVDAILNAIEEKGIPQKQHIFYDGQIFDAYIFVSDIIKSAKTSIKLLDNYIDKNILVLFSKRDIYHFGASLKDLGKKWFAVSKMDIDSFELIGKLK